MFRLLARNLSSSHRVGHFHMPTKRVRIVEVGARDGLQNEKGVVPTEVKLELIRRLASSGINYIEATSFVSPKWVPQMGDHSEIMEALAKANTGQTYAVLTPNKKGAENAIKKGAKEIAVFISASEAFSKKNINCTIEESLNRSKEVMEVAQM